MTKITKARYEFALARIEELLPMVDDNTPSNDRNEHSGSEHSGSRCVLGLKAHQARPDCLSAPT